MSEPNPNFIPELLAVVAIGLVIAALVTSVVAITENSKQSSLIQQNTDNIAANLVASWTWHPPVRVVSLASISPLEGEKVVDGVWVVENDRVLLVNQDLGVKNGIWIVQHGVWTRPSDFPSGQAAGSAYTLVLQGTQQGSAWLVITPKEIVDQGALGIETVVLSPSGVVVDASTMSNVGAGPGEVYLQKVGNDFELRTLQTANGFLNITNNGDELDLEVVGDATNTPDTLMARNGSGYVETTTMAIGAGSAGNPSLRFLTAPTVGLSVGGSGQLQLQTNGVVRVSINSSGLMQWLAYTTAGILQNDASGNITSTGASSSAVANTIMLRDANADTAIRRITVTEQINGPGGATLTVNNTGGGGAVTIGDTTAVVNVRANSNLNMYGPDITIGNASTNNTYITGVNNDVVFQTPTLEVQSVTYFTQHTPTVFGSRVNVCQCCAYDVSVVSAMNPNWQTIFNAPMIGSLTLAPNTTGAGTVWQFRAWGVVTSAAASTNVMLRVIYNNTDFSVPTIIWFTGGGVLSDPFNLEVDVVATNAGTLHVSWKTTITDVSTNILLYSDSLSATYNPAIANTVDVQVQWSTAGNSFAVQQATLTMLNLVD